MRARVVKPTGPVRHLLNVLADQDGAGRWGDAGERLGARGRVAIKFVSQVRRHVGGRWLAGVGNGLFVRSALPLNPWPASAQQSHDGGGAAEFGVLLSRGEDQP